MQITITINDTVWANFALLLAQHRTECQDLTCPLRNAQTPEEHMSWQAEEYLKSTYQAFKRGEAARGGNGPDGGPVVSYTSFQDLMNDLFGDGK